MTDHVGAGKTVGWSAGLSAWSPYARVYVEQVGGAVSDSCVHWALLMISFMLTNKSGVPSLKGPCGQGKLRGWRSADSALSISFLEGL